MGYSLTWIAIRDLPAEDVGKRLDLVAGEPLENAPDSSMKYGVSMPASWYIVVVDDRACVAADFERTIPNTLHDAPEVVLFETCDTVMYSTIAGWAHGRRTWHIVHDPDTNDGIYDLRVDGNPPEPFEAIRRKVFALQEAEGGREADIDWIYEAPKLLGEALTGYNHAPDPDVPELTTPHCIHELTPARTLHKGERLLLAAARSVGLEGMALRRLGVKPNRMLWW